MSSQRDKVKEHLLEKGSITPREALDLYGCFRLGGIIYRLRNSGYNISTVMTGGVDKLGRPVNYATYFLIRDTKD